MRAKGQKTSEGAASAFCTWNNLCKHECSQAKTNSIRELDERLGAICGLVLILHRWLTGNKIDRTTRGVLAIRRTLRPTQHLDALALHNASSSLSDQLISQQCTLIFTVSIEYMIVHLALEQQVHETFPRKANTAMKLHRAAGGEYRHITGRRLGHACYRTWGRSRCRWRAVRCSEPPSASNRARNFG